MGPKVKKLKPESQVKTKLIPVSVAALPEEIEVWRRKADVDDRPLSSFLRRRLLAADKRDEEIAAGQSERQDG